MSFERLSQVINRVPEKIKPSLNSDRKDKKRLPLFIRDEGPAFPCGNRLFHKDPRDFIEHLTDRQRKILNFFLWFDNRAIKIYMSLPYIAKMIGACRRTVWADIQILIGAGLLSKKQRCNSSNLYRVNSLFWLKEFIKACLPFLSALKHRIKVFCTLLYNDITIYINNINLREKSEAYFSFLTNLGSKKEGDNILEKSSEQTYLQKCASEALERERKYQELKNTPYKSYRSIKKEKEVCCAAGVPKEILAEKNIEKRALDTIQFLVQKIYKRQ